MKVYLLLLITLLGASTFLQDKPNENENYYQYLKDIAQKVNNNKESIGWQASEEQLLRFKDMTKEQVSQQNLGAKSSLNRKEMPEFPSINTNEQHPIADSIPENFDSREQWNNCQSIKEIRHQDGCGSCWAFGGVEAFSDRWCIASGQKDQVRFSAENLVSCCDYCGQGCKGGYNVMVWDYFMKSGIVEGGPYGSNNLCQAYSIIPDKKEEQMTPKCRYECDSGYKGKQNYEQNLHFSKSSGLIISKNIKAIQTEIMTNGPVEVLFFVYDDLYAYKGGVYKHTFGKLAGGHAVKMLGWGVENGTPYWLCANSWGTNFGLDGFFKIYRGDDECGIEHEITYGTPDLERKY